MPAKPGALYRSTARRCRRTAAALLITASLAGVLTAQAPTYEEPYRPRYHFTPARNWMNDPNGLVYFAGEYHLFFQHNPFANDWGHMSWGHAVSRDLVHWQELPVALAEANGEMVFSGSAVVDRQNTSGFCTNPAEGCLVAIYTGHVPGPSAGRQTQNIAYSNDRGRTWTRYAGNPVIDLQRKDFRDPKVIWHAATRRWVMAVVLPPERKVQFYGSPDLKKWELLSEFGPAGTSRGIWECPDLFPLAVEGSGETRWVLIVSVKPGGVQGGSAGQYFIGDFDGRRFTNANPPSTLLWLDQGKDLYAAVTFSDVPATDGRRLLLGWMSNWQYAGKEPTAPFRTAQSLPRELRLRQTKDGLRLAQSPAAELKQLRTLLFETKAALMEAVNRQLAAGKADGQTLEIELELELGSAGQAGIDVFAAGAQQTRIAFDRESTRLFLDRRQSGNTTFSLDFAGLHWANVPTVTGPLRLHLFLDRSSVEVFTAGGLVTLTDRIFPAANANGLRLFASGGEPKILSLRVWRMGSIWPGKP